MGILKSITYNVRNLTTFTGRNARWQFWPYAIFVFVLSTAGMIAVMLPEIFASLKRIQEFAAAHPELATVQRGSGS